MILALSLTASLGTVLVMWLLGGRHRAGWVVSLCNQPVWIALAALTEAWGLLPLSLVMVGVAVRGWCKWTR